MSPEAWRQLDPHDLPDWPLGAQLCLLAAFLVCSGLLVYALVWRDEIVSWQVLEQQQQDQENRLAGLRASAKQMARLAPLLPSRGLGCQMETIRHLAAHHRLTLLLGTLSDEITHGELTEATATLLVHGAFPDIQMFLSDLTQADTAWLLDPLNLTQGANQQLELQASVRCIRQTQRQGKG